MNKIIRKLISVGCIFSLILGAGVISSYEANAVGSVSVYRLYNSGTGEYLYSTDSNEITYLTSGGDWANQGIYWEAPETGTGVYRLYDPKGYHLYTSDQNEIRVLTTERGWSVDNNNIPMFYSGGGESIYRAFHPVTGRHLLTGSKAEYDRFVAQGWNGENVAFSAISVPEYVQAKKLICIDPGHQRRGDSTKEPNGPGSGVTKARVTQGTTGRTTGTPEYVMNLEVSLMLRDELVRRGYDVVMTRETHDVNISNMERAQLATNAGADITVRIHGNGSDNTSIKGALVMVPTNRNPYVANLADESRRLGQNIVDAYCAATGMSNKGIQATDTMTGINFSTMPVCILEMGFMSNPQDDTNMQNADFRKKMVSGIADGIDKYFN